MPNTEPARVSSPRLLRSVLRCAAQERHNGTVIAAKRTSTSNGRPATEAGRVDNRGLGQHGRQVCAPNPSLRRSPSFPGSLA
jgi:hypothetical protein